MELQHLSWSPLPPGYSRKTLPLSICLSLFLLPSISLSPSCLPFSLFVSVLSCEATCLHFSRPLLLRFCLTSLASLSVLWFIPPIAPPFSLPQRLKKLWDLVEVFLTKCFHSLSRIGTLAIVTSCGEIIPLCLNLAVRWKLKGIFSRCYKDMNSTSLQPWAHIYPLSNFLLGRGLTDDFMIHLNES